MNKQGRSRLCATLTAALAALLAPLVAEGASIRKQYEVTQPDGKVVTVSTSADRENVVVTLTRQGQPAHVYHNYPQAATTVVKVGQRTLFRYYIYADTIAGDNFEFQLERISGPERSRRAQVVAIRQQLQDDMRVLRAVRAHDPRADVLLAELAYVVLTYDDQIMDGAPPASYLVRAVTPAGASAGARSRAGVIRAASQTSPRCKLDECKNTCDAHYAECQADQNVADKTTCHKNRTSCTNTCYQMCSPATEESSS